jgi:hypothetical protein
MHQHATIVSNQVLSRTLNDPGSDSVHCSPSALARLGLRIGEPIRFRRHENGRWITGRVSGIATDGSVNLRDPDGSARSIRAERVEIRRPGSRGRLRWRVVSEVAVTWQQLEIFNSPEISSNA